MTDPTHTQKVRDGQARSAKHQAFLRRIGERKERLAHERKVKKLFFRGQKRSSWELICGAERDYPTRRPEKRPHHPSLIWTLTND